MIRGVLQSNGAIYIINVNALAKRNMLDMHKNKYVMGKIFSVDIDDELDLKICEYLIQQL
jgi:CMP-N,N'-diacetyllegionaminic acid synthase